MSVIAEVGVWQAFLDGLGYVFSWMYDLMPKAGAYGLSIILLTVFIRILLVPLGIKQIRGMQAMQAIQPRVKALQQKFKGNKQRQQEEIMKLYKESGVNPFAGCWPVLLQFPIFIALYAVLRPPVVGPDQELQNNHLPPTSAIYHAVVDHSGTDFLWMNLQCSALQGGTEVKLLDSEQKPVPGETIDCGSGTADKVPYFAMLALMIGSTFYSSRQMQKASPPGAVSQQQKSLTTIMPLMFGVFGFQFPAGLVLYWTTSNLWQIGQQGFLLKAGHIGPAAIEAAAARAKEKADQRENGKGGLLSRLQGRAMEERRRREGGTGSPAIKPKPKPKPGSGGSGGSGAGSRKKRPKR